jgi:plasmid stability protein
MGYTRAKPALLILASCGGKPVSGRRHPIHGWPLVVILLNLRANAGRSEGEMETPFAMNEALTSVLAAAIAGRQQCWHYESMAIQINIRDVPERVRDELAARAALQGKSMQEFLRAELERLADRPSIDAWLQQVRARKRTTQTRVSARQILANRNADRR